MVALARVFSASLFASISIFSTSSAYATISDEALSSLPDAAQDFDINSGALLAPILKPRVPGTPGSSEVLQHFVDFFKTSLPEWRLEFQNSTSTTPTSDGKEVPFHNLIATRDPPWTKPGEVGRLALVAHYDSLSTLDGFIGAIDSAAPCAMLMQTAKTLDKAMTKKWDAMKAKQKDELDFEEQKGVQILLLDGEEAFLHWSHTDSTYGARALAEEWEGSFHPAMSTYQTALSSISLFLLLDLLGSANPNVPSYYLTTHWAYQAMAKLESRLRELHQFKSAPKNARASSKQSLFLPDADKKEAEFFASGIEDDHIPFLARGVEVLHIIPSPFPQGIWHQMADDGAHLDMDTVEDWTKLVTAFAAEWMELDGHLTTRRASEKLQEREQQPPTGRTEL